jgi:hypothetical protein
MPHEFFWLLIPLGFLFGVRGRWAGRPRRGRGIDRPDRDYVAELERVVETQQAQIESLEARVARVEEGLDFTERVLGEHASGRLQS